MGRKLADPLPLRRSTETAGYVDVYALPQVYGRGVTLSPRRYDASGYLWLIADHPIQAVDAVLLKGRATDGWRLDNGTDTTGHGVAVLETAVQVADPGDLAVTVRGKLHPTTGALLEAPHAVLWDLLANVCGLDLAEAELDALRSAAASIGLVVGGVLDNPAMSIQGAADAICQGSGLAWCWQARGLARLWPAEPDSYPYGALTLASSPSLRAEAQASALCTRLVLEYAFDWARGDHRGAVIVEAPAAIATYGLIERTVTAGWLMSARQAEVYARRLLGYLARPIWRIETALAHGALRPGDTVSIAHPYSPLTAAIVTGIRGDRIRQQLVCEAAGGAAPAVRLVGHTSGQAQDPIEGPIYDYLGGLVTVQILLPDGFAPAVGARVLVDNTAWLLADAQGYVQFRGDPGRHSLSVVPIGGDPFSVDFVVA